MFAPINFFFSFSSATERRASANLTQLNWTDLRGGNTMKHFIIWCSLLNIVRFCFCFLGNCCWHCLCVSESRSRLSSGSVIDMSHFICISQAFTFPVVQRIDFRAFFFFCIIKLNYCTLFTICSLCFSLLFFSLLLTHSFLFDIIIS